MRIIAIIDNEWVRCRKCKHKLFRITTQMPPKVVGESLQILGIEVKCHSCKEINEVKIYDSDNAND